MSTSFWGPLDFLSAPLKLSTEKLKFLMKLVKVKNRWTSVDGYRESVLVVFTSYCTKDERAACPALEVTSCKVNQRSPSYKKNPIPKIGGSSGIPVLKSFKPKEEKEAAPFYPSVVRRERWSQKSNLASLKRKPKKALSPPDFCGIGDYHHPHHTKQETATWGFTKQKINTMCC